jgi:hypothetical protein
MALFWVGMVFFGIAGLGLWILHFGQKHEKDRQKN